MLEYDDDYPDNFSTYRSRYTEEQERRAVEEGLASFKWSVVLDGNLLHINVNYDTANHYMDKGTDITIIVPFMRGVSTIYPNYSSSHEQAGFHILMHGTDQPITIGSGTVAYTERSEYEAKLMAGIKAKMAVVRHEVLAAINEYHTRPYKGEQFKLKL